MKPPLTWLKMTPSTRSPLVELLFEPDPALFAAGLLARQHRFAKRVLDALDIDFDCVADLERAVLGLGAEFLQRDAAFDLQADVDDRHVFLDGRDDALDDLAFPGMSVGKGFFEEAGEIVAGGIGYRHWFSWRVPICRGTGAVG